MQRSSWERDDTRDRAIALLVIGDHPSAETERACRLVQRAGLAFAPVPKGVRCHRVALGEEQNTSRRGRQLSEKSHDGAVEECGLM